MSLLLLAVLLELEEGGESRLRQLCDRAAAAAQRMEASVREACHGVMGFAMADEGESIEEVLFNVPLSPAVSAATAAFQHQLFVPVRAAATSSSNTCAQTFCRPQHAGCSGGAGGGAHDASALPGASRCAETICSCVSQACLLLSSSHTELLSTIRLGAACRVCGSPAARHATERREPAGTAATGGV